MAPGDSSHEHEEFFANVRNRLAPPSVGVWYQKLTAQHSPRRKRWKRTGDPIMDADYQALFGYDESNPFPAEERSKLIDHSHKANVLQRLLQATNCPDAKVYEVTFKTRNPAHLNKTAKPRVRWLYARIARLSINGEDYLACWNADVTFLKERESFLEKVISTIPGFVFLKEWDQGSGLFKFKYCNQRLIDALGEHRGPASLDQNNSYLGTSDADYFDEEQSAAFLRNDLKAFNSSEGESTVAEERFAPHEKEARTLTTVKVRFDTSDEEGGETHCVLGIAFDLTGMMGLLKEAMELSGDGLFIKNPERRYLYANKLFRNFIGVPPEGNVVNRTFEEVQLKRYGGSLNNRLTELVDRITAQDEALIKDGGGLKSEQTAFFSDGQRWIVEKRTIGKSRSTRYILGVAKQVIDPQRINTQIIKHSPQFICIKDQDFRILHCNWTFAERRGLTVEQCFGKTDYDFWPEKSFPGQAERFQDLDRKVLDLLPLLDELDRNEVIDEKARRAKRREILREFSSYPETLEIVNVVDGRPKREIRHLLTTKWPDRIEGEPVVHVSYVDVTDTKEQLARWHRFTIHAIGNEMPPFEAGFLIVKLLLDDAHIETNEYIKSRLEEVYQSLLVGRSGMKFYVDNHLKFLTGECDLSSKIKPSKLLLEKLEELHHYRIKYLQIEPPIVEEEAARTEIFGDGVFIKAAITEMLRNALKALERRYDPLFRSDAEMELGRIRVTCRIRERADKIDRRSLVISVRDNGDGGVPDSEAAKQLKAAVARMKERQYGLSGRFGFHFLASVAKDHGGVFSIKIGQNWVETHLVLPIE